MASYKNTTEKLLAYFASSAIINEVTFGDFNEVDLTSKTNFPLVHIIPQPTSYAGNVILFAYQILFFDKLRDTESPLVPMDRMEDAARQFINYLYFGMDDLRVVPGSITAEPIWDQRINRLYGWALGNTLLTIANVEPC
jgi:hypothetical protein